MEAEPGLPVRILEFGWALLPYWWLIVGSVIFAVEPMIEGLFGGEWKERIDRYWPKEKRHGHFRWASIAALLIASFWFFDDVSTKNRVLQRDVTKVIAERDEVRRERDDALGAAKSAPVAPQKPDRSGAIRQLQKFYSEGGAILQFVQRVDVSRRYR